MTFYLSLWKVTAVKCRMKQYPVLFMIGVLQQRLFYNKRWKYFSVRVEEIPQGRPYKLARNIVEHKETSINKGVKHLRDCLEKRMWVADVFFWFVAKCLKKLLHCHSNLQRNKNVIPLECLCSLILGPRPTSRWASTPKILHD